MNRPLKDELTFQRAIFLLIFNSFCLCPRSVAAINTHTFSAPVTSTFVATEQGPSNPAGSVHLNLTYDYINDPLVRLNTNRTRRLESLIDALHTANAGIAYSAHEGLDLGISSSMSLVEVPGRASTLGLGDTRLYGKIRLTSDVSLLPEMIAPTGSSSLFLSSGGMGTGLHLLIDHQFGPILAAANLGYRYQRNAVFEDLSRRQSVVAAAGLGIPLDSHWMASVDGQGEYSLPSSNHVNPGAVYGGFRYMPNKEAQFHFAGGVGSLNGYSSADVRAVAGVTLAFLPAPSTAPIVAHAPRPSRAAPPPRVEFNRSYLIVRDEIHFEHAKAILLPYSKTLLNEIALVLHENRTRFRKIVIEGHTNELGTVEYNQKLSENRAASVRTYLIGRGIPADKLIPIGYGKSRLKQDESLTYDALLAARRRVAFRVIQ